MKTSMSIIIFFVACLAISAVSLAAKESPVEACIRKNTHGSRFPPPSDGKIITDEEFCRDEARIVNYILKLKGKFPHYYVEALCSVFGDDDYKVKEYVIKQWLNVSKEAVGSLYCA